jgi:hypothetical protein
LKQPRKAIPSKLLVNDILEGEVEIPPLLQEFFEIPMWVGWNANFLKDTFPRMPMQKIAYLPQLNVHQQL